MPTKITIFDTTLRDGAQGEGISLSADDKIKIAMKLDTLGVQYIEGGNPGSNSKDIEFFERAKHLKLTNAKISAFGSTRKKHTPADQDPGLRRILNSGVKVATLVGKSWDFHVRTALQTTLEENLAMIYDSFTYLKQHGLETIYDAEHFFDGYKNNPEYAMACIQKAEEAQVDWIVLCDTNGGALPGEIYEIVSNVCRVMKTPIGIHTHNDSELAVANSIAGIQAGARQLQGTINGYGERCGNANLCSVIPNLQIKLNYSCVTEEQLQSLTSIARFVGEIANVNMPVNQPYVGAAAFAHKGGIHVSAILKDSKTYEHIVPAQVGNKQRVLVSELSGQSNLLFKAQELNLDITSDQARSKAIIDKIKEMEHQGYTFEGADASLELLLRDAFGGMEELFVLESFKLLVEKSPGQPVVSEAILKLKVNGESVYTVAEGNGPVNALDNALRKALIPFYPAIRKVHLADYKVRVIDEKDATAAKVRVLIESTDFQNSWNTVGVSENVIEASWLALIDSIRYALIGEVSVHNNFQKQQERLGIVNH